MDTSGISFTKIIPQFFISFNHCLNAVPAFNFHKSKLGSF